MEVRPRLVPGSVFKTDGTAFTRRSAGSIPVRFRQTLYMHMGMSQPNA